MRLAEPEARELRHVVPGLFGGRRIDPAADRALEEVGAQRREHLGIVQMPAHVVGVGEVVAGERRQRADHLLVEDDHPEGLLQRGAQIGMRVGRTREPGAPGDVGADHVGLHRARAEQRDVDDQVLEPFGLELLEQLALARRLDLEAAEGVGGADQLERRLVVERDPVEVDLLAGGAGDLLDRVTHRREHAHAEDVELEVAERLDVVLVGLDHAVPAGAALQRHALHQVVAGQHDAAGVQRDVSREPVEPLGHPEQQIELAHRQLEPLQLGQPFEPLAQVARRDVREGLGHDADLDLGQPQRLADLADRRARPVGVDHRDAGGALMAVAREDHVVDVLAPGRLHVDVDVGQLLAHRVQEPLERQVVPQRVDVGDAGDVAHERARGAAATGREDAHRLDVGHDVGHGQEVGRVAHLPDHRQLQVHARAQTLVVAQAAFVDPAPAPLGEQRRRGCARRRREVGEMHLLEPEIERARARRSPGCGRTGRVARRTARASPRAA